MASDMFECSFRSSSLQNRSDSMLSSEESQDLLAPPLNTGEGDARTDDDAIGPVDSDLLNTIVTRAVKRAIEPLVTEMKFLKKQNIALDKKLSSVLAKNEAKDKLLKEISAQGDKGVQDLNKLMTSEGVKRLKIMCLRNLDLKAKNEGEVEMLKNFLELANENGWIVKTSATAEKQIIQNFREKRNYLKAQIRLRVFEDLTNKTPEQAVELPKTIKFLRDHLGVTDLSEDCLLVLYHFGYVHRKYLNRKVAPVSDMEKKIAKRAAENPWVLVMERVTVDRETRRDYTTVKERFLGLLNAGHDFEPK
eukprot:GFUD01130477.1.p1 GENE.GFUD01130477.1~~GFUD01130477.1.p1  ORF type:complete len:306 (-),score=91.74 GFUD01130477.1:105-1022(-)